MTKMYEVLNFCFDNDNGCSLTVLSNGKRCHVTVDPKRFQDRSKKGKEVQRTYEELVKKAKASEEEEDEGAEETEYSEDEADDAEELNEERDSAIDVSTPEVDEEKSEPNPEPIQALQDWIITPLAQHLPSNPSKSNQTLQEWYHTPVNFFTLSTTSNGKVEAKEDTSPPKLMKGRLEEWLIPTINLPKKTMNLSIPQFDAEDLTVLSCAKDPAPYHPTLVKYGDETLFLKPVDPTQPGPSIREIHILNTIAKKGLHDRDDFRCPQLRGLVHFSSNSSNSSSTTEKKNICALVLTPIPDPTPLTLLLDPSLPEEKRSQWAQDAERMVEILHENDLVWGDAKGDNFLVDGTDEEKVWMIDFGGSYTEGWVDKSVKETEEGDWQGTEKVIEALESPERDDEEDKENGTKAEDENENGLEHNAEAKVEMQEEEQEDTTASEVETDVDEAAPKSSRKRSRPTETEVDAPAAKQRRRAHQPATTSDTTQDTTYCFCNSVSSGRMLACDGSDCKKEWFHFECLGIEEAPPEEEEWFCEECREKQ